MTEPTTRRKQFSDVIEYVSFDEVGLSRLAHLVESFFIDSNTSIEIEIESGDGEDQIRTSQTDYFMSLEMPAVVRKVRISGYSTSLYCAVTIASGKLGAVVYVIDGSDANKVIGSSHELDRTLRSFRTPLLQIRKQLNKPVIGILFFIVCIYFVGHSVESLYSIAMRFAINSWSDVSASSIYVVLDNLGWLVRPIGGFIGGSILGNAILNLIPVVEFSGKLSDPGRPQRTVVIWLVLVICIPIAVNLFTATIAS